MRPRIPNSGPEMKSSDLLPLLTEFACRTTRSTFGALCSVAAPVALYSTLLEDSIPVPASLGVRTPTSVPPEFYRWALRADFSGGFRVVGDANAEATAAGLQIQVFDGVGVWTPLSAQQTGTQRLSYPQAQVVNLSPYSNIALHAVRPLTTLPDPALTQQIVRVAWGITGAVGTTFQSIADDEAETGGWDFTARFVLERIPGT